MSALSQRSVAAKCWKRMNAVARSSRLITNSHCRFRSKVEFTRTINSIALTLVLLAAGSPKRINQFFQPITKMDRVGRNEVYWTGAILRAATVSHSACFLQHRPPINENLLQPGQEFHFSLQAALQQVPPLPQLVLSSILALGLGLFA